ncbi:MAG: replication initiator protein A [Thiohalocapsa sp.]
MTGLSTVRRADPEARERCNQSPLLPDRHPHCDFFVCGTLNAAPKDDIGSMEHPMFGLSTKPDRAIRRYEYNGNSVEIAPGAHGLATIWDKDILIYCTSQLVAAVNRGADHISRTVRVTAHDLLVATNRGTDGRGYAQFRAALDRLAGTRITTDIRTNGQHVSEGFGLIDRWKIIEASPEDKRMVAVEIVLSEWLYNAVCAREVLTISKDYFRLRKGLERRLYEIARKHCGRQRFWQMSLPKLYRKSGSSGSLKEFRRKVKAIIESDHIPEYKLVYDADADLVRCYCRDGRGALQEARDALAKASARGLLPDRPAANL